jgi:hypothetical protein
MALYVKRVLFFVEFRLTGRGSGQVSLRIWIFWFFSAVLGSLGLDIGSFGFSYQPFGCWIWMYWFFGYCFLKVEVDWRGLQVFVLDIGSNFFRSIGFGLIILLSYQSTSDTKITQFRMPDKSRFAQFSGCQFYRNS